MPSKLTMESTKIFQRTVIGYGLVEGFLYRNGEIRGLQEHPGSSRACYSQYSRPLSPLSSLSACSIRSKLLDISDLRDRSKSGGAWTELGPHRPARPLRRQLVSHLHCRR